MKIESMVHAEEFVITIKTVDFTQINRPDYQIRVLIIEN